MKNLCNPGSNIIFGVSDEMLDILIEWSDSYAISNENSKDNMYLPNVDTTKVIDFNSYKNNIRVKRCKKADKDYK